MAAQDADVIVIGSGAGGLAAAVALSQAGKKVLVLEQHEVPGGWCHSFALGGHRFSPGVHYIGELGPGGRARRIYEGLGLGGDLVFCELNPDAFDHVHVGNERFDFPKGRENLVHRLKDRFPQERAGISRYFDIISSLSGDLDAMLNMNSPAELLRHPRRVFNIARWGLTSLESLFDQTVKDPLLRAFLGSQAGDHGLPPSLAPAAIHAAVVSHYFDGGWYPRGGGFTIPRAFVRALKRAGSSIRLRTRVAKILTEKGKAIGVRLESGEELRAPLVISNADPHATFRLCDPEVIPASTKRRLKRTRYSTSAISLFFAAEIDTRAAGLDSGNVWYFGDKDVEGIYRGGMQSWDPEQQDVPGFFLTCTTLKDPAKRKSAAHTFEAFWFLHNDSFRTWQNSQFDARPGDYVRHKELIRQKMFAALDRAVPGLSSRITFSDIGSPLTNTHYVAASEGNLYGTEKSRWQIGPWAWPLKSDISGLWMCGASTVSHGVMGATLSGLFAAKDILGVSLDELLRQKGKSIICLPSEQPHLWPERFRPSPLRAPKPAKPERGYSVGQEATLASMESSRE